MTIGIAVGAVLPAFEQSTSLQPFNVSPGLWVTVVALMIAIVFGYGLVLGIWLKFRLMRVFGAILIGYWFVFVLASIVIDIVLNRSISTS